FSLTEGGLSGYAAGWSVRDLPAAPGCILLVAKSQVVIWTIPEYFKADTSVVWMLAAGNYHWRKRA
ncbi:MAG TPA: hypothetical protein VL860_15610, partial [Planctomycetota bacterium]|nr:hypothetical protein [Planctomycetota bacterium]